MSTYNETAKRVLRVSTLVFIMFAIFTPMVVGFSFYFPYIVGKGFFIKAFVQIAVALYIILAIIDPASRPRRSPLMYAVIAFLVIVGISNLLSVNPWRSFWSNYERMEGYSLMLHLGALFVVASSVIKKREWMWIGSLSLVVSIVVGISSLGDINKAVAQAVASGYSGSMLETVRAAARISGPLGNSSYLGVYALIHAFFALLAALMVFRGNREYELLTPGTHKPAQRLSSNGWIAIVVCICIFIFNLYILLKTGTRGAFVGFVGGMLITSGYLAWKERSKVLRFTALGVFTATIISVVLLGVFKNSTFVQSDPQLARYASLISLDVENVFKTFGEDRKMIWGMALQGVKEKPLFGWGQDNFGYVFAKYYDPGMYAREHWFDRSHNVFLDWLIAAGALGLIGYLSLFVIAAWFLFSKKTQITVVERSVFLGVLVAYFIHNLFVFDNLSSYVVFFMLLAYIHDRYTHDRVSVKQAQYSDIGTVVLGTSFAMLLILSLTLYQSVFVPMSQNLNLAKSLALANEQSKISVDMVPRIKKMPMDTAYDLFKDIYASGRPTSEVFEQLNNITAAAIRSATVSEKTKVAFYELLQEKAKFHLVADAGDPRYPFFLYNFYNSIGDNTNALVYAQMAYDLSPKKQSFAQALALIHIKRGESDKAIELVRKAYQSDPRDLDSLIYYVSMSIDAAQNKTGGFDFVKLGGVAQIIADAYHQNKHEIGLKPELWAPFKQTKQYQAAQVFAQRLGELIPEHKAEFQALAK